jgi:Pyruvate/2-oxoacid:ferredoxin oxidoreductase delta subunit
MKKSSTSRKLKATIDRIKCFGCGLCAVVCDPGAVIMKVEEA